MSKFEELKRKAKDQIFCGIAKGEVSDNVVDIEVEGDGIYWCSDSNSNEYIDHIIKRLDKNWEEKHSTANRNSGNEFKTASNTFEVVGEIKAPKLIGEPKSPFEYRLPYSEEDLSRLRVKGGRALNRETLKEAEIIAKSQVKDEVNELIESRSNGTYSDISDTASAIIEALGTDSEYTYFFSQVANKLARVKNGYSVEDSLLDIAGYAKLELDKYRGKNEG